MEQVVPEGFILNKGRGPYTTHNGPFYINASVDPWLHGTFIIDRHCNGAQIAHGGMLMSFADGICGHAVYKETKTAGVTIKLNSEFLSAARPGEWLEGYAIVNSQKDDFVFCESKLYVGNRDVLLVNSILNYEPKRYKKK